MWDLFYNWIAPIGITVMFLFMIIMLIAIVRDMYNNY